MRKFIVLLGPPGAGKGTQAKMLAEKLALAHISSGDIFRENLKAQTELGKLAQIYIDRGDLVPDDVTIAMIEARLQKPDCSKGAVLDGFPRTPAQADALKEMLKKLEGEVVSVPFINVPAEVLVERLSGRWSCRAQGHVFHSVNNPPKTEGICDFDGSELYQRDDDKPETVKRRIHVYGEQTAPLLDYYTKAGLLVEIDGTREIDQVAFDLLKAIERN
ncbi:MAG TPA: adenylate kinase [Anaerolineaceae bacterium]|mgnify:CR=1 FL=1|nr:adenylate kinase [Anaerolineaceae bacterium]